MNKTELINKIDKAMDRLDFLDEIMESEKILTTGLNSISDILFEKDDGKILKETLTC